MSEPSIEPPNVFYAALAGTAIFGGAGFFYAGTVAVFRGYSHGFRYSILTTLNTGVFGGIWFGTRAGLLYLPGYIHGKSVRPADTVFASAVGCGLSGGLLNIINSRGPRMAIPATITFSAVGAVGQVIVNYFAHALPPIIIGRPYRYISPNQSREDKQLEKLHEYEDKFSTFDAMGIVKKPDHEKREQLVQKELDDLDVKLAKVEAELAALEKEKVEEDAKLNESVEEELTDLEKSKGKKDK